MHVWVQRREAWINSQLHKRKCFLAALKLFIVTILRFFRIMSLSPINIVNTVHGHCFHWNSTWFCHPTSMKSRSGLLKCVNVSVDIGFHAVVTLMVFWSKQSLIDWWWDQPEWLDLHGCLHWVQNFFFISFWRKSLIWLPLWYLSSIYTVEYLGNSLTQIRELSSTFKQFFRKPTPILSCASAKHLPLLRLVDCKEGCREAKNPFQYVLLSGSSY